MKTALITPAYHRDAGLLDMACAQVDRFCPGLDHIIVASRQKRHIFAHLESGNRRIVQIEDVIRPLTWRAPVHYRKRELYFTRAVRPVDGWVMQQIVKLAAPDFTDAELLLNLDSDVFFVRPFKPGDFVEEGRVRLLRKPPSLAGFQRDWHQRAQTLFGLPPGTQPDYVGSLIAWRRDVCLDLRDRLASQGGKPWLDVLTREKNFSEYTLYGTFVERVLGGAPDRQFVSDRELCLNSWDWRQEGNLAAACVSALRPHHVAINLQSNLRLPLEQTREILAAVTRRTGSQTA